MATVQSTSQQSYQTSGTQLLARAQTRATVNSLPPEILEDILCQWRYEIWDENQESWPRNAHAWVKVLRVCKYWYNIAMRCAELWSHIHLCLAEPTRAYIERSGRAPLHLKGEVSYIEDKLFESLIIVFRQLPRLKSVNLIYGTHLDDHRTLYWFFYGMDAPMLQSVTLAPSTRAGGVSWLDPIPLPWAAAPNLTALTFRKFDARRIAPAIVPSLKTLRILECTLPWCTAAVEKLLDALQNAPHLEELELHGTRFNVPLADTGHTLERSAALPRLRALTLSGSSVLVHHILAALALPADARVALFPDALEDEDGAPQHARPRIAALLQTYAAALGGAHAPGPAAGPRTLALRTRYVPGRRAAGATRVRLHLETWARDIGASTDTDTASTTTTASTASTASTADAGDAPTFRLATTLWDADALLRGVCGAAALDGVRALCVADVPGVRAACWVRAFRGARGVRTLVVAGAAADALPAALLTRVRAGGGALFLPALECLVVKGVRWREYYGGERCALCRAAEEPCDAEEPEGFLHRLKRALKGRAARGAAVKTLKVVGCVNFGEAEVDELKAVVPEVVWDGVFEHWAPDDGTDSDESDDDEAYITGEEEEDEFETESEEEEEEDEDEEESDSEEEDEFEPELTWGDLFDYDDDPYDFW